MSARFKIEAEARHLLALARGGMIDAARQRLEDLLEDVEGIRQIHERSRAASHVASAAMTARAANLMVIALDLIQTEQATLIPLVAEAALEAWRMGLLEANPLPPRFEDLITKAATNTSTAIAIAGVLSVFQPTVALPIWQMVKNLFPKDSFPATSDAACNVL